MLNQEEVFYSKLCLIQCFRTNILDQNFLGTIVDRTNVAIMLPIIFIFIKYHTNKCNKNKYKQEKFYYTKVDKTTYMTVILNKLNNNIRY